MANYHYCPICDSELKNKSYYESWGGPSESSSECYNRCYAEYFAYGHKRVCIFDKEIHYSYNEDIEYYEKQIKEELAYWLNDYKYLTKIMEEREKSSFTFVEKIGVAVINKNAIANIKWEVEVNEEI